jgi:hypothetical protein
MIDICPSLDWPTSLDETGHLGGNNMSWNIEEYLYLKSLNKKNMKTVWVHENTEDENQQDFICRVSVFDSEEGEDVLRLILAAPDLLNAAVASIGALKSGESGIARLYLEHSISMAMDAKTENTFSDTDEPVEHSVDLDILAQTINDSLMDRLSINDDGLLSDLILDALKSEFKGQSLHMREDEE